MINSNGIIQNNKTASDFIRKQRKLNKKYQIFTKDEERSMIESYARLKRDENGKISFNDDFECDFEWVGNESEMRKLLTMHNLQAVTNISSKHCQDTRDYDNMYAKGLYGLTKASNIFHPFRLVVTKTKLPPDKYPELIGSGEKKIVCDAEMNPLTVYGTLRKKKTGELRAVIKHDIQYDESGNPNFVKFNTFAQFWIFKYVMQEFYDKGIKIDNNSTSIHELVKVKNGVNKTLTFENYLDDMISPDYKRQPELVETVSSNECTQIYDRLRDFINSSPEISSLERGILEETFYNSNASLKKLSTMFNIPQKTIVTAKESALSKLRGFLHENYGIYSVADVI